MLLTCFIILTSSISFGLFSHAIGTINLLTTPSLLCEQDVVEFNCTLSSGITYASSIAGLSINDSTSCITGPDIFNGAVARLNLTSTGGTTTAPFAQYTISPFLRQDNATRYRCCAQNSASPFNTEFTLDLSLLLAAPPYPANVNIFTTYDSANSCTGTLTLTWLAVASDRPVTSYTVLLNGTVNAITTPLAMNSYTTGTLNLLEHYATYTVMAISCAGISTSSPVIFMPPNPPNSFTPNITCTMLNQLQAELNISLPAIITDRPITHYILYINNIFENNTSADGSNYEYSTILQLSSYSNFNITTIAYSCAGSYSNITITEICDPSAGVVSPDSDSAGLPTGAIVGIVVGGACFIIIAIAVILLISVVIYCVIKRKP